MMKKKNMKNYNNKILHFHVKSKMEKVTNK